MKKHLVDFFKYNSWANSKLLETIKQLPDQEESCKLFSHFITTQDKWLNRITKKKEDSAFDWFAPVISIDELESRWKESVSAWIAFFENLSEAELDNSVVFNRTSDQKKLSVTIKDLALQLNYHSIHHRAQINKLISRQGIKPPPTDYIYTVLREV